MATELVKIREGWGDWMLYGHEAKNKTDICPWWLLPDALCDEAVSNFDGTYFNAYHLDRFPANRGLIIAWRS